MSNPSEQTQLTTTLSPAEVAAGVHGMVTAIQDAHEEAEDALKRFGNAATEYALHTLRVGAMLHQLRETCREAKSRNFEVLAGQALAGANRRTIFRYTKAYGNYMRLDLQRQETMRQQAEKGIGQRSPAGDDDDVIDVTPAGDAAVALDPKDASMAEILLSPEFDRITANGRSRKSLFCRVRNVLGDRGITKLYRDADVIPRIKKGTGKARGEYITPAKVRAGKRPEILLIGDLEGCDEADLPPREWDYLGEQAAKIFAKHGWAMQREGAASQPSTLSPIDLWLDAMRALEQPDADVTPGHWDLIAKRTAVLLEGHGWVLEQAPECIGDHALQDKIAQLQAIQRTRLQTRKGA